MHLYLSSKDVHIVRRLILQMALKIARLQNCNHKENFYQKWGHILDPSYSRLGQHQMWFGRYGEEKNLLPPLGIKLISLFVWPIA
jgi:hypothetical protein